MTLNLKKLSDIGWTSFFQQQLNDDDMVHASVFRVTAVHRGHLVLSNGEHEQLLPISGTMLSGNVYDHATIGDWILISRNDSKFLRKLERKSLFSRKAPGTANNIQLIAANIDIAFIVTSCNDDFNLSRLERYLAMVYEAEVFPVIILTKMDTCENWDDYINKVGSMDPTIMTEAVNALDSGSLSVLEPWLKKGQTIAFFGSSGVGKTTLINTIAKKEFKTQSARDDDAKGRHTTTHRSLVPLQNGCILLDSPGMRELQLFDTEEGINQIFSEIEKLARSCRFRNCSHTDEPNCAVKKALENGQLEERRFNNYQKLLAEQERNSATMAEKRKKDREFGKMIKSVKQHIAKTGK